MKNSRYIWAISLTVLILINSISVSLNYAYYELDPIGFIESLCENQDKPELECNGKCHLNKVAQSQDKKQNTPESIVNFKELILFPSPESDFLVSNIKDSKKSPLFDYQNLYSYINSNNCFHPPRIL